MIRAIISILFLVVVGAGPSLSVADEGGAVGEDHASDVEDRDSPGDTQRAQKHFDKGAKSYYEGNYGQAAVEFRRANETHPHPLFLYNFALATKRLGQLEEASNAAREADAMEQPLPAQQQARNRGIIHSADVIFEGRKFAGDVADHRADSSDHETLDDPSKLEGPDVDDSGFGTTGWLGIGAVGLGTAGLVAAGTTHYGLEVHRDEFEQRQGLYDESEGMAELEREITRRKHLRNGLVVSGLALVGLGTGIVFWQSGSTADEPGPATTLSVTPSGGGISVHW